MIYSGILCMCVLSLPSQVLLSQINPSQLIPLPDDFDPREPIFVQMMGNVTAAREADFAMEAAIRLPHVPATVADKLSLPVMGYIPDSDLRYQGRTKPIPRVNTLAAFGGWVTGISGRQREDGSPRSPMDRLEVHIHSVAFMGKFPTTGTASGPSTPSQTPNGIPLAVIDSILHDAQ
jgi:hypothetical protein